MRAPLRLSMRSDSRRCVASFQCDVVRVPAGTPLLVLILSVATCLSAAIAFVAAVSDESHFAALETWTLLSGLGAALVAALTHTLYFRIRRSQWYGSRVVRCSRCRVLRPDGAPPAVLAGRGTTKAKRER